jgi:hypothetical protein
MTFEISLRARWRMPIASGLVLVVAACGTTRPSQTTKVDSCSVVTRSEAGHALGQTVKPPVVGRASVEGGAACVFYGPHVPAGADPDVPVSGSVRVVLVTGAHAKPFFDDYRTKVPGQPVAGLGDRAYYDGYASLSVLKGDAYLRIAVIGVRDVLGAEKQLAAAALPRISA